jgi:hypothetical protein
MKKIKALETAREAIEYVIGNEAAIGSYLCSLGVDISRVSGLMAIKFPVFEIPLTISPSGFIGNLDLPEDCKNAIKEFCVDLFRSDAGRLVSVLDKCIVVQVDSRRSDSFPRYLQLAFHVNSEVCALLDRGDPVSNPANSEIDRRNRLLWVGIVD